MADDPLVINTLAKIQESDKNQKQSHTASWKVVLAKWATSIIIALIFLACLVHSKISLLALSGAMNATSGLNMIDRSRIFVKLQIIALAPHAINLIRGIWCGVRRSDRKNPKQLRKWILATVLSLLESLGICFFIFCLPGLCKPSHTLLVMNCVFILPLIDNMRLSLNRCRHANEQKWVNLLLTVAAFIAEILGICVTTYLIRTNTAVNKIWIPPVGVFCLSIPWIPSIQKYLVENTYYTAPSSDNEVIKVERTAWKLTAFMSFVKLLSTFGFSMMIYYSDTMSPIAKESGTVDMTAWTEGFKDWSNGTNKELIYFVTHIIAGFVGYVVGYVACTTRSQKLGFSIPLMAATPLTMVLLAVSDSCSFFFLSPEVINGNYECTITKTGILFVTVGTVFLVLAQILSTWLLLFRSQLLVMLGEDQLFWTPMYNSALLEHWIMLSRRNELTDIGNLNLNPEENAKRSRIFICTTMYRETEEEMKQLLESLKEVNDRVAHSTGLQFESHIFFDGAVRHDIPTEFLSQLVALVSETLGTSVQHCTKIATPYGMSLSWILESQGNSGLPFTIHLKDNSKVKNKKRWSQVMYMSFVLDCQLKNPERNNFDYDIEEKSYILTTDADVKFTPDNVESLLDLMTLDSDVGAVCARTHPLGSGPVVWYQKFEYAIGHWFQKAAEHVIGSVLCSPGCFSVYRCKAIRDVLPLYATNVEKAEEFLTKDMGRIDGFARLWFRVVGGSNIVPRLKIKPTAQKNSMSFSSKEDVGLSQLWQILRKHNLRVSSLFLVYQVILLVATLIGPSSVILVVSGGLKYGSDLNPEATLTLQVLLCTCFTIICLYTSQKVQLYVAKCLTGLYAVVMMIVIVGTAVEIVTDVRRNPESVHNYISDEIRISTTSVYLFSMAGIFVTAGFFHLGEITCLFHGLFYLLLLPSGYLILVIYSICNITDSSWGTREGSLQGISPTSKSWQNIIKESIKNTFFCCSGKEKLDHNNGQIESGTHFPPAIQSNGKHPETQMHDDELLTGDDDCVEDWLGPDMKKEAKILRQHGYDNTSFISGMTKSEIKKILPKAGTGKINALLNRIEQLKDYEIPTGVPENVERWLEGLDLQQYKKNFKRNSITTQKEMEILKCYTVKKINKELKITKTGHIKRLLKGIDKLRKPKIAEAKRANVRQQLVDKNSSTDEHPFRHTFWKKLTEQRLLPQSAVFESDDHLRVKLRDLRNSWLAVFAMVNILWLILISTLADKGEVLSVFGSNPVGLVVIVLFGFIIIVQFLAMIIHRLSTLMHFLGRAPYTFNSNYHSSWRFGDSDMRERNDEMSRSNMQNQGRNPQTTSIESYDETASSSNYVADGTRM